MSDGSFDHSHYEVATAFQSLVGPRAVRELAERHHITAENPRRA